MQQSPEIKQLADALAKFQAKVGNVTKDAVNPFFKSKYASLENVIETIREPLGKHGLSFSQFPDGDGLTTVLMHESGEWIQASSSLAIKGEVTPQSHGSAITYLRRYALSAILGLATEDDDDGNAASTPSKTPPEAQKQPVAHPERPNPPAFKSEAQRVLTAKLRIAELVDKIKGEKPEATTKEDKAAYYGDAVQEYTKRSLELANVDELELIGEELSKLAYPEN